MRASSLIIDRRESIRRLFLIGVVGSVTLPIFSDFVRRLPVPRILPERIDRIIGENALPIPDSWYRNRTLDRVSIDSVPLNKSQIDSLPMPRIDYSRVCNCNPNNFVHTTKYGISLPETFERLGIKHKGKGQIRIAANDCYLFVPADAEVDNTFFSASEANIPKELRSDEGLRIAAAAKLTPYGVFVPYGKGGGQAWKDLVDVKSISFRKKEVEPRTYFVGPDGEIIQPENHDVSMSLEKLVLTVSANNRDVQIPYSKIKRLAEGRTVIYDGRELPSMSMQEMLGLVGVRMKEHAIILHANNYVASIPPCRQDGLTIIFNDHYAKKRGVPTKLVGGPFLNKAAQIEGFYRIDVIPIRA